MSPIQYSDYKDSGAEWLGPVPARWSVVPLWSLFRRSKQLGTGNEELLSVYRDYGVIPKSSRDDNLNKASEDLTKYQVVEIGDLVINKMKAWQGSVAVSEHHGIVSPAYFVFKHLDNMNLRFMHYLMRSVPYFQHYASISSGVRPGQWDLDPTRHRVMPVLLPPLDEQQAIANYLDYELAEIDAFIADQEELIALLNERRKSALHAAAGSISGARQVRLRYLYRQSRESNRSDLEVLSVYRDFGVIPKSSRSDNFNRTPEDVSRYLVVRPGYLVINKMKAWQGSLGISAHTGIVSPDYEVLIPTSSELSLNYAHHMLRSPDYVVNYAIRSVGIRPSQWRLYWDQMKDIAIPVPTPAAQENYMHNFRGETAEIDAAIADARESVELSRERRASVISAAVTGKIDVRERAMTKRAITQGEPVGVA